MRKGGLLPEFPPGVTVAPRALKDLDAVLRWSADGFGSEARKRYQALLIQAFRDISKNPERAGSKAFSEKTIEGVRGYHLESSRKNVLGERVKSPRHLILYRIKDDGGIEIGRILHDGRDLERHIPAGYRNDN